MNTKMTITEMLGYSHFLRDLFKFSELFLFHEVKFGEKDWQPFGVEEASE